jgi:ABC-2 type transport system permease protein
MSTTAGVSAEQAPSETRAEPPTVTRYLIGFGGLFVATVGVVSVFAAGYGRGLFGAEFGYLFAAVGTAMLLFHALRDGDLEIRRAYGAVGAALLLVAVGVGVFPAKPEGSDVSVAGHLLLPWGGLLAVVALLFLVAFARHETEEPFRSWVRIALLGTGGLLAVACVVVGLFAPDLMAGPGAVFGVLGVAYLCGYFTVTDTTEDQPYWAGVGFAALFVVGSFAAPVHQLPAPYLVPGGLVLGGLGALFLAVAVGVTVDAPLVVLFRRELAAYFYSPIAYVVLFANAGVAAISYLVLVQGLFPVGKPDVMSAPVPEPIVQGYWALTMGAAFTVPVLVAVITMRLFSEEKRTGTLEVLLTAPVNDWAVVLSKFAAALAFFMACWLPAAGYLIALRYAGGSPFDYRPLLSYYLAMFACGCGFVGLGVFVSSLTRNQIAAAVVTFAALFAMLLTALRREFGLDERWQAVLGKLDYFGLWQSALSGQLPLPEVCVHLSLGLLWLFLTVKVLEARRWA